MATQTPTQTIEALVEQGVGLVFQRALRPTEAATQLVRSPSQLDTDEQLVCLRRAFAVFIEEALDAQKRVPRFDIATARMPSNIPVREEDMARISVAAEQAKQKLDAFYASQNGQMKPLKHFTASDHQWRADYATAQAKTWGQWHAFHDAAYGALSRSGANQIADLSVDEQTALGELIP